MSIGKYAGFDNDDIRIPQMPKILGRSGPGVRTTYVFKKVFYKIGNEWFNQDFTVTTTGGSAAAKRLLLGAVMKSRTFNEPSERERRHSFRIVYQNGNLNVTTGSDTDRYTISQADLTYTANFRDEGNSTRIERVRGRVESLRAQYLPMRDFLALHSRSHNLEELNEDLARNLQLIENNAPNRAELEVQNDRIRTQIDQLDGYRYYLPGRFREHFFGPDEDQLFEKVQSQLPVLEQMSSHLAANTPFSREDACLKQQIVDDPTPVNQEALEAAENRLVYTIGTTNYSLSDLEKRVDDLYSKFGPIEQHYLALKKQITESQRLR